MNHFSGWMRNVRAHLPLIAGLLAAGTLAGGLLLSHYCDTHTTAVSSSVSEAGNSLIDTATSLMEAYAPYEDLEYASSDVTITEEVLGVSSEEEARLSAEDEELTSWAVLNYPCVVMAAPNDWSQIVTCLPSDTKIRVPADQTEQDGTLEIYYGDLCGYVDADAVILYDTEEEADAVADVTHSYDDVYGEFTADMTIYSEPDTSAEVVAVMDKGSTVELMTSQYGWYYIHYEGGYGYVPCGHVYAGGTEPDWHIREEQLSDPEFLGQYVVETAKQYLGCPYVWAASGPTCFDCSGFTMFIMAQYGVSLPHSAADQFSNYGTWVDEADLIPGDLVYFRSGTFKSASHTGMYIGDGQFIHASSSGGCVTISNLSDTWYANHYVGAKRMLGN